MLRLRSVCRTLFCLGVCLPSALLADLDRSADRWLCLRGLTHWLRTGGDLKEPNAVAAITTEELEQRIESLLLYRAIQERPIDYDPDNLSTSEHWIDFHQLKTQGDFLSFEARTVVQKRLPRGKPQSTEHAYRFELRRDPTSGEWTGSLRSLSALGSAYAIFLSISPNDRLIWKVSGWDPSSTIAPPFQLEGFFHTTTEWWIDSQGRTVGHRELHRSRPTAEGSPEHQRLTLSQSYEHRNP